MSKKCMSAHGDFYQYKRSCLAFESQFVSKSGQPSIYKVNRRGNVWQKIETWEECIRLPGCTSVCVLGSSTCWCSLQKLWRKGMVKFHSTNVHVSNGIWKEHECNKIETFAALTYSSKEETMTNDDVMVCITGQWSRLTLQTKTKNLFREIQNQGAKSLTIAFVMYVVFDSLSLSIHTYTLNTWKYIGTKIVQILQNLNMLTRLCGRN